MMINTLIIVIALVASAGIAIFGSLRGARLGAEKATEGVLDLLKEQMQIEALEKEKEKTERIAYVQSIIFTFINKEIQKNYELLDLSGEKNLPIGTNFQLEFEEYEKTKYMLLENPTRTVREINKLYSLFHDIIDLNNNKEVQDKLKKVDEIIDQKEILDILLSDIKYMKNI